MRKRVLSLVLSAVLVLTVFSVPAEAKENISWSISEGVLYISGTGKMRDYPVNEAPWSSEAGISYVMVGDGITYIGENAFSSLYGLRGIFIPDSVTEIGDNAVKCSITGGRESAAKEYAYENSLGFRYPVISLKRTSYIFTGEKICPEATVRYSDYTAAGDDYTVSYENNLNAGKAKAAVSVAGIRAETEFEIIPADINSADISLRETESYTGKVKTGGISIEYNGYRAAKNRDYILEYDNNIELGTASVTIKGTGNFYGQTLRSFEIIPSSVSCIYVRSINGNLSIEWGKAGKEADGYEIEISTSEDYSECDRYEIEGRNTVRKTVTEYMGSPVAAAKPQYIRIRAYAVSDKDGLRKYSQWYSYTRKSLFAGKARNWLGYSEKNRKYRKIIDSYNSVKPRPRKYKVKYTDPWCATFVSAVISKSKLTDILPRECSCQVMINLLRKRNLWIESDSYVPEQGDIIFYDWNDTGKGDCTGWADHVGIVESVSGSSIRVIEGNRYLSSKRTYGVGYRTVRVNGKYIRGYGVWRD